MYNVLQEKIAKESAFEALSKLHFFIQFFILS